MNKIFSEPKQNYKGMWVVEVTRADGFTELIVERTTKKGILAWLKENKPK